jgi:hypothetical protein
MFLDNWWWFGVENVISLSELLFLVLSFFREAQEGGQERRKEGRKEENKEASKERGVEGRKEGEKGRKEGKKEEGRTPILRKSVCFRLGSMVNHYPCHSCFWWVPRAIQT